MIGGEYMKLESQRIDLIPLTAPELSLAIDNYSELQQQLGLAAISAALDDEMQYAMQIRLKKVQQDPDHYLWLTNWYRPSGRSMYYRIHYP